MSLILVSYSSRGKIRSVLFCGQATEEILSVNGQKCKKSDLYKAITNAGSDSYVFQNPPHGWSTETRKRRKNENKNEIKTYTLAKIEDDSLIDIDEVIEKAQKGFEEVPKNALYEYRLEFKEPLTDWLPYELIEPQIPKVVRQDLVPSEGDFVCRVKTVGVAAKDALRQKKIQNFFEKDGSFEKEFYANSEVQHVLSEIKKTNSKLYQWYVQWVPNKRGVSSFQKIEKKLQVQEDAKKTLNSLLSEISKHKQTKEGFFVFYRKKHRKPQPKSPLYFTQMEAVLQKYFVQPCVDILQEYLKSFLEAQILPHSQNYRTASFSKDESYVVAGNKNGLVRIWKKLEPLDDQKQVYKPLTDQKKVVRSSTSSKTNIYEISFSKNGKNILLGSHDGSVSILKQEGQQIIQSNHGQAVYTAAFDPDCKYIVSGGRDRAVKVWKFDEQTKSAPSLEYTFRGHLGSVLRTAFSPDREYIVSGSKDHSIKVWVPKSTQPVSDIQNAHTDMVTSVSFSPDGKYLLSAGKDGRLKLWLFEKGTLRLHKQMKGHTDRIWKANFNHAGDRFVSTSSDGTVKMWHTETGRLLQTVHNDASLRFTDAMFSPSDRGLVTVCSRGITYWE